MVFWLKSEAAARRAAMARIAKIAVTSAVMVAVAPMTQAMKEVPAS